MNENLWFDYFRPLVSLYLRENPSQYIEILKNGFRVRQIRKNKSNSISANFSSVPKIKIQQIIEELKTLENYEKWTVVESN